MVNFYSKDKVKFEGSIDIVFKNWLECNFGYYTQGLLVDANWDSTVVYQYDPETDKIRSTFNEVLLKNVNVWRIYQDDNDEFYLGLYWDGGLWGAFVMSWLTYDKPEYVILPQ